jgi:hypothetical protein
MATKANIVIDQGTTFNTNVDLTDENGDPLNLDDYTAKAQIRRWYTSATATDFTIETANGVIQLSMNAATTSNLTAQRYVYDVVLTSISSNTVTRVLEGYVTVNPRVTVANG